MKYDGADWAGELADTSNPVQVSDVEMAFPAKVRHLMPAMKDIPDEFRRLGFSMGGEPSPQKFNWIAQTWFSKGLPETTEFHLRPGIDGEKAIRHLHCILGSFQPKHEHKIAAVGFLLSEWCEDIEGV